MQKSQAIAELRREADAVKAFGATELYPFGSTVRDSTSGASDLDVFVDYDRSSRFSLVELAGIKQLLEHRLGVVVDVTTRDSLDPLLRDRIEATAERIFWCGGWSVLHSASSLKRSTGSAPPRRISRS